jgi:hypothetical protein
MNLTDRIAVCLRPDSDRTEYHIVCDLCSWATVSSTRKERTTEDYHIPALVTSK